jgi:hypothetical protein
MFQIYSMLLFLSLVTLLQDPLLASPMRAECSGPSLPVYLLRLRGSGGGSTWNNMMDSSTAELDGDRTPPLMATPLHHRAANIAQDDNDDTEELVVEGAEDTMAVKSGPIRQPWVLPNLPAPQAFPSIPFVKKEPNQFQQRSSHHQPGMAPLTRNPWDSSMRGGTASSMGGGGAAKGWQGNLQPEPVGKLSSVHAPIIRPSQVHVPPPIEEEDILDRLEKALSDRSNEWSLRVRSIQELGTYLSDENISIDVRKAAMQRLLPRIITQLEDKRSQIVKEACTTLSLAAESMEENFEHFVPRLLPVLLQLTYVTVRVISQAASDCLRALITSVRVVRVFPSVSLLCCFSKREKNHILIMASSG